MKGGRSCRGHTHAMGKRGRLVDPRDRMGGSPKRPIVVLEMLAALAARGASTAMAMARWAITGPA